jgi:hypothetical protein
VQVNARFQLFFRLGMGTAIRVVWSEGCREPLTVNPLTPSAKKAGVAEYPEVFGHAGLLSNWPPGTAGLPFSKSSDALEPIITWIAMLRHRNKKASGILIRASSPKPMSHDVENEPQHNNQAHRYAKQPKTNPLHGNTPFSGSAELLVKMIH